jgi:hypothetical protein
MELNTKVTGRITWLMGEANSIMLMEIFMKAFGSLIKLMDMELMCMQMGLCMKENGLKINNKDRVKKHGKMEVYTTDTMLIPKRKAKDSTPGQMGICILETGRAI